MDNALRIHLLEQILRSPTTSLPVNFRQDIQSYLQRKDFCKFVFFIRTLIDKMNKSCNCSEFVISVLNITIKDEPPETEEQTLFRRKVTGLEGMNNDDDPMDPELEITRVGIPRSNPSWPVPA